MPGPATFRWIKLAQAVPLEARIARVLLVTVGHQVIHVHPRLQPLIDACARNAALNGERRVPDRIAAQRVAFERHGAITGAAEDAPPHLVASRLAIPEGYRLGLDRPRKRSDNKKEGQEIAESMSHVHPPGVRSLTTLPLLFT